MHTLIASRTHLAPSYPGRGRVCVCVWVCGLAIFAATSLATPVLAQVAQDPIGAEGADGLDVLRQVDSSDSEAPNSEGPNAEDPNSEALNSESPDATSSQPRRRLWVLDTDCVNMETLTTMLRVQAPDWDVVPQNIAPSFLRIDRLIEELAPHEALLWFESGNPMIRIAVVGHDGVSYVSLLPRSDATTTPEPVGESVDPSSLEAQASTTRSLALVVAALLSELEQEEQRLGLEDDIDDIDGDNRDIDEADQAALRHAERSRDTLAARVRVLEEQLNEPQPSRWPSPIKPDGWFFRFGWANAFSPHHELTLTSYGGPYSFASPTGGLRVAAGRHFRGYLSVGASIVTLHAHDIWNGSVSAFASIHTPHRFRIGIGLEIGVLVATETDQWAGTSFGWTSPRFYIPVELAGMFTRKGGLSIKCGPTILRTPLGEFVGYDLSVEWEFD